MAELHISGQISDGTGFAGADLFCEARSCVNTNSMHERCGTPDLDCGILALAQPHPSFNYANVFLCCSGASPLERPGRCCKALSTAALRWSTGFVISVDLSVHTKLQGVMERITPSMIGAHQDPIILEYLPQMPACRWTPPAAPQSGSTPSTFTWRHRCCCA